MYLRFYDSLVFFGTVVLKRGRQGGRPQHIGECFKQEDLFPLPGMFCEVPTIAIPLSVVIGEDWKTSSDCTMAAGCFCAVVVAFGCKVAGMELVEIFAE